jgi:LacI family transcriptional regulator
MIGQPIEPGSRRPTIADVAADAGVSQAAVSKVLRDAYGLSPEMRAKVQTSIEKLGYRPSVAARAMRGATFTIGVMIPDQENAFFTEVLKGAIEELEVGPYQLILAPVDQGHPDGRRAIESLVDRQVAGLVAISPLATIDWMERMARGTPVVELGRHDKAVNYDTIVGDDESGAHQIMDHLLANGHRAITHFTQAETGSDLGLTTTGIRRRVYLERMAQAGLSDQVRVVDARFVEDAAYSAMSAEFAAGARPTAVFAGNDQSALGVLRALAEADLSDVAVVGYDNTPIARHPRIDLSSVSQDGQGMGRLAMQLLLERIAGRRTPVSHVISPELIIRGSSSQPVPRARARTRPARR